MRSKLIRNWQDRYTRFMEGRGLALLVTLCVAVIAGTAVWTKYEPPYAAPTPPVSGERSAASLMQQHLSASVSPTPLPSTQPIWWHEPLETVSVVQPYSNEKMTQSATTGVWRVHQAIDLQGSTGDRVFAIADGVVAGTGVDALDGTWLLIRHSDEYQSRYAGLSALGAFQTGDRVRAGQTVGFVGSGVMDEAHFGPHLHLSVTANGQPIDPAALFESPNISH